MSFLIVATFKSNKTNQEVKDWLEVVTPVAKTSSNEVVVAPSFPYMYLFSDSQSLRRSDTLSFLKLASQDVSPFPPGSYTGAVNAVQLKDLGVKYCLIGHSERRRYFHESHADVANKARELLGVGITPILCLAEEDIFPQFAALDSDVKEKIVYCFEPPAEIGGTETAPLEEIGKVVKTIRDASASPVQVMYGGSVNAGNVEGVRSLGVDGVLVSTACLDPNSFNDVIKLCNS